MCELPSTTSSANQVNGPATILDIRRYKDRIDIKREIEHGLGVDEGAEKSMPTILLYDEEGLRLFEEITYLEEVRSSTSATGDDY